MTLTLIKINDTVKQEMFANLWIEEVLLCNSNIRVNFRELAKDPEC